MKKIIYLLMIAIVGVFTSCDPMDDIYTDLDAHENVIVGEVQFALSDDDYDDLSLSFGNFNSIADAKAMIPGLLTDKYPVWGEGSLAEVTFKWYNKIKTYSKNIYALSANEHNEITGQNYGNFSSSWHIYAYLDANYSPSEGDFVSLRYDYYSGITNTLTDGFYYEDGEWNKITGFTEDQYIAMGESFPNFSSHDEAAIKIPISLLDVYRFNANEPGDIVQAMYELYKGGGVTKSYTSNFIFDGTSWSKYNNVAEATVKFGHNGTTWVPDNTVRYTLVAADYSLMADALSATYPNPASSMGNFGNFDRRSGNDAYWSDSMVIEALNVLLDSIDPSAAEGQKYVITIAIYNGASGTENFSLIKAGGEWVVN